MWILASLTLLWLGIMSELHLLSLCTTFGVLTECSWSMS